MKINCEKWSVVQEVNALTPDSPSIKQPQKYKKELVVKLVLTWFIENYTSIHEKKNLVLTLILDRLLYVAIHQLKHHRQR